MADLSTLNRVRYAGLDFDTLEDDLRARLQVKFASSFNDFSVSSLGIVLLDMVSFGLDTLSFYLDRRATDTYLATARSRRSVALLTRQLGYKMSGSVASSVDLKVAPKQLYAFPIPVAKGFQFVGPNGILFETAQLVTFPSSSTASLLISCYQGQTVTESFVSDGTANQVFKLTRVPTSNFVVSGSVVVTVNAASFSESDFITFDATDQFEVGYNDDPPTIRFGDGVAGNIPISNATISVTYIASLGRAGQVLKNTITAVQTPLTASFTQIDLVINNEAASIGGDDPEDLDHAKTFAPRVFKARRVAVTRGDYEALAGAYADPLFGRVAVAQAISARSDSTDLTLQNLLINIEQQLTDFVALVQAAILQLSNGATGFADLIVTANAAIQLAVTAITSKLTNATNSLTVATQSARTIKSLAGELSQDQSDLGVQVVLAKNQVDALAIDDINPERIKTSTKNALDTYFNKIFSLNGIIGGLSSSISAGADTQTSAILNAVSFITNDIGDPNTAPATNTPASLLYTLQQALNSSVTSAGVQTPTPTGLFLVKQSLSDAIIAVPLDVTAEIAAIADHVNKILSADCQANLVVVPILARDASGFYAAPSIGLIQSLQDYLDGIKEVTQTVSVTSGAAFLVPAAITIRVSVKNVSEQVTKAAVITLVDGILRDRAFGASLYLSDLILPIRQIAGVVFDNVTITGPSGNIDPQGNLLIDSSQVITLDESQLIVTTETFQGVAS